MTDNITEINGLPVNVEGEVLARLGVGGRGVAGTLPKGYNPVNAAGEMVVNLIPAGTGESLVTAKTNPLTGMIEFPGDELHGLSHDLPLNPRAASSAYLVMGGDHPYAQWKDGLYPSWRDAGVRPYLAINTDAGSNLVSPGDTDMLTWAQIRELAAKRDMEVVSHGARHVQDWCRLNTGLKIVYTGANATATVQVSATQLIATAGGGDSRTLTLADETLATVKSKLEALAGWSVTLAPELKGTESASALLQIAATNVKTTAVRFAAGGGIVIYYTGTVYRYILAQISSNTLKVFADGQRVVNVSLSAGATLSSVVTAINVAGVTGLVAKLCDNQKAETSSFESYVSGSELAVSLANRYPGAVVSPHPAILSAGLSHYYMVRRQLDRCAEAAAANGVDLAGFSNSGAAFVAPVMDGQRHFSVRGNSWETIDITMMDGFPNALPVDVASPWRSVSSLTYAKTPTAERIKAVFAALQDSPGFLCDLLMHKVLADGSSQFAFPSAFPSYYDQIEGEWIEALADLKPRIDSGAIKSLLPREVPDVARRMPPPTNRVFNPLFQNSGESLVLETLSSAVIPGWGLYTPSASHTSVSVTDGVFETAMATASERTPLKQYLHLMPGKTYRIGVYVEVPNYTAGNGVSLQVNPIRMRQRDGWNIQQTNINRSRYSAQKNGELLTYTFTVPPKDAFAHARIVSKAFGAGLDLSTNKNINLNVFARGVLTIDLSAGAASVSAVKAWEAAAAINSAIKANASYPPELHTLARAENDVLILEVPTRAPDTSYVMTVVAGTTVSATTTVFGSDDNFAGAVGADAGEFDWPLMLNVLVTVAAGTIVRISHPFCSEVITK